MHSRLLLDAGAVNSSLSPRAAVEEVRARMASVRHKILVLSGKGGVGKSTFAAHLAHGLASDENRQVCCGTPASVEASQELFGGNLACVSSGLPQNYAE